MSAPQAAPSAVSTIPTWGETLHGKWVILVCYIGKVRDKVVYVIEWETKPWKKRGQEAVIFETVEDGETNEQAAQRAIREELDLADSDMEFMEDKWKIVLDVNRDKEREHIIFEAQVFLVQLRTGTIISQTVTGTELIGRWTMSPNAFNGKTRPGTKLALKMAIWSRDSANPMPFVTIRDGEETGEY